MTDLRFLGDIVPAHVTLLSTWMAAASVSLSLFHARTLLPLSFSLLPFPVAPKSSSKHNNRVWRGSGVQRRCWKVWLALLERSTVPWTRREIGFRGWYSVYIFPGTSIRNFFNYNYLPSRFLFFFYSSLLFRSKRGYRGEGKTDKLTRTDIYIYERNKVNRILITFSLLLFYFNARSLDLILRIIVFLGV